jgi:hypothetical protein
MARFDALVTGGVDRIPGGGIVPAAPRTPDDQALDEFARRAGPDAAIDTSAGIVQVYAVFAVDPQTKRVRVSVVDAQGRLIRMIPPENVGEMIAAMASYQR